MLVRGLGAVLVGVLLCAATATGGIALPEQTVRAPVIHTTAGELEGIVRQTAQGPVAAYLGVRYGLTTAGDNRWRPPVAAPETPNVRVNASWYGDGCPGGNTMGNPSGSVDISYSEDCLFLNVWVPMSVLERRAVNPQAPSVVWIHGGGFMSGTAADPQFWGEYLAGAHGAIVVSMNYRVGALGFLCLESEDPAESLRGNYGVMDQQLAVRWIRKNIQGFGGDADRVTLWGQSAGAMSVLVHTVSEQSNKMFQTAVMQSPVGLQYRQWKDAAKTDGLELARLMMCFTKSRRVKCMREQSAEAIVKMQLASYTNLFETPSKAGLNFLSWMPVVDSGSLLAKAPLALLRDAAERSHRGVGTVSTVLVGSVTNETDAWLQERFIPGFAPRMAASLILRALVHWDKDMYNRVADGYDTEQTLSTQRSAFETLGTAATDLMFTCYTRQLRKHLLRAGVGRLWSYVFSERPLDKNLDPVNKGVRECVNGGAACHASDISYIFASFNLTSPGYEVPPRTADLLGSMHASYGDLLANGRLPWPVFDEAEISRVLNSDAIGSHVGRYRANVCEKVWDDVYYTDGF